MTYEAFDQLLDKMEGEERHTGETKGMEYTQGDRLDNFRRLAKELGLSPKQVLWVYLKKHLDAIANYIKAAAECKEGDSPKLSEPIEGRIMDARVYLSLLRGIIEEDRCVSKTLGS